MLNLLSITETIRHGSPQRRVNAGIPVDWARLYIPVLLAGMMCVGCGSIMPNIPPSLPGARLVPGTENCSVVVRGDNAVWWGADLDRYYTKLVKTDPQSHEVLARIQRPEAKYGPSATGFEAVWSAEGSTHPSVYKFDAQAKSPPQKISLGISSHWARGSPTHLAVGDHAVWATAGHFSRVFRIDPDTGTIVATVPVPGSDLVAAGEGAVWVTSRTVTRIDPETNRIMATIPIDMLPFSIATGGGAVWVAFGPKVIRINPLTNKVEATFNVFWDSSPARYNFVLHMVAMEETLWALVFTESKRFSYPDVFGDYALVEIDIKTNTVRTTHRLGSGEGLQMISRPQRFAMMNDAAWVCLPTGMYVIPIADPGNPEAGK